MNPSENVKQAMAVLSVVMSVVCYIYDTVSLDLEELDQAVVGQELAEYADLLMCVILHNMRCQCKLVSISHELFGKNDTDSLYDRAK